MDGRSQDEQLAHQCVQGDELAWRDFVDRYTPMVYSLCIHAGLGPMDAEDVCQEAMLSALRSLGTYRGCRLSTWLYRITRRRLADHFRSPQRRLVPIGLSDEPSLQRPAPCPSPVQDQELIKAGEGKRVREALQNLRDPPRSVMLAYYLAQMPVREVAREMGMPENTVKSHLRRGRQALRRDLEAN